jgi:hypothetical protein
MDDPQATSLPFGAIPFRLAPEGHRPQGTVLVLMSID